MALHEVVNLLACLVLLGWLLVIADRMPSTGHRVAQALTCLLALVAGWQAIGPFFESMDQVTWSTAILHALLAVGSLVIRRELVGLLDTCFPPKDRPTRRSIDPKGNGA